jgi:DNA polymerase bacteriophage-type
MHAPQRQTLLPLHLDFETRSVVPLDKRGAYVYAEHPLTDVWCAAFAIGDDKIKSWLPGQPPPPEIVAHIAAGGEIWAHNSAFERLIWTYILTPRYGWPLPPFNTFQCTMARACVMALPSSLKDASAALGLTEAKDAEGHRLMMTMSKPRRYNEDGSPVWWDDDPVRLARLVKYCMQDVAVERALHRRVNDLRRQEHAIWLLDQVVNDRGVKVDRELCATIQPLIDRALAALNAEMTEVSGGFITSVNNVADIAAFCRARGVNTDSVAAAAVEEMLARDDLPVEVRRVLEIRAEASKASVKKITALQNGCSADGRARGLLAYHIASTGRWAGRRFQPQNIKRPGNTDQETLITLVRYGSLKTLELLAGPPLEVIGDILRGLLIADPGNQYYAGDFSAIESRVLAWLAGEHWKLQLFRENVDIYEVIYRKAFPGQTLNKKISSDQRQIGKVMDLACGYQGAIGAFQSMAANYRIKVTDRRARELVDAWRWQHPRVVSLWPATERIAVHACQNPGRAFPIGKLMFKQDGPFLYMRLPSGRLLTYPFAKVQLLPTPWGVDKPTLTFKSNVNPSNAKHIVPDPSNSSSWARVSTYGGSLIENAVQGIARDLLAEAMLRIEAGGFPIVLTVHDEVVSEAPVDRDLEKFKKLLVKLSKWADGLPVSAKSWCGPRYKKD